MSKYIPASQEEKDFLASYDPAKFAPVAVTVDVVLLTIRDGQLCVLLVRRGGYPYKGRWALPGGFLSSREDAETSAWRELAEETGIERGDAHLEQLGTYTAPDRDPRTRVVSIAYLALLPDVAAPTAGDDAADAEFFPVANLRSAKLAFDHDQIIKDGLERAASKLEYTPLATAFCGPVFTISDLRRVYETVWQNDLDPANFRRKVLSVPGFVQPAAAATRRGGPGAPAAVYVPGTAALLHPPLLRPSLRAKLKDTP